MPMTRNNLSQPGFLERLHQTKGAGYVLMDFWRLIRYQILIRPYLALMLLWILFPKSPFVLLSLAQPLKAQTSEAR